MWLNLTDENIRLIKETMASRGLAGQEILDAITDQENVIPEAEKYIDAAARKGSEGSLEVDADAVVSMGDDAGAYVMAWLWVTDDDAGIEPPPPTGVLDWRPKP